MTDRTLFDELGEERLRAIIDRFVDRIFDDVMIGFFFRNASRERIKAKEYEFAARHLGAPIAYTGRPIQHAHAQHPIMGGQFMRRLQILKETLAEFEVPAHIVAHWIRHTEALRPLVTRDSGGRCDPVAQARPLAVTRDSSGGRGTAPARPLAVTRDSSGGREPVAPGRPVPTHDSKDEP